MRVCVARVRKSMSVSRRDSEIRRVVTAHDAAGKAVVLYDGPTPAKRLRSTTGTLVRQMWITAADSPAFEANADRALRQTGIAPPHGGTAFRIVDFAPVVDEARLEPEALVREMRQEHAPSKGFPPRHPFMHRTRSVDYAVVLSGEIDMLLDDSEVHLKAGDVVVQQGTNHAWVNRGSTPCRIAFVLIDTAES